MYTYRRQASPLPRLILIITLGGALLLAAAAFGLPRVIAATPQGDNVSGLAAITLTFSAEMDPASVENNLQIEPAVVGVFSWVGPTLTFTPAAEWPTSPVHVQLRGGAQSLSGLPLLFGADWEFSVGAPQIAFLLKPVDVADIWTQPLASGSPAIQITDERFGVDRFAGSPDGTYFVYAALRADGGADLKRIDRAGGESQVVLECPFDRCTAPTFSPDGRHIAFERHPLAHLDQSTLEVLTLADGRQTVLNNNPGHITRFPAFARDGRLAYLSLFEQEMIIHDFNTGQSARIPNQSSEMGVWSPDGQYLLFPEIISEPPPTPGPGTPPPLLQLDTFFSHLQRVAIGSGLTDNLSGDLIVEDATPRYSPSGEWIAFGRKDLRQESWTPGRQLWIMRATGAEARALTADPLYNHSNFVWSPDGTMIIYARFDITDPASTIELWSISANGAEAQRLIIGGYLPEWLP